MTRLSLMVLLMTGSLLSSPLAAATAQSGSSGAEVAGKGTVTQLLGASLADLPDFGSNFSSFELDNGLQVVVIPDHRAPVVTHMIWYKVGSADEKPGESGIAHFLEHLMFKGTKLHPDGSFSKSIAAIGGEENAFTSYDYTAYFQRVAKQHLGEMMAMEADRMANLELREDQVVPELQVILEERVSRIDNNPSAQLGEALSAVLYRNHPYGIPIIGWEHEMRQLDRQKAIDFYNLYYTPNNAVLVVAGDVTEDEVRTLATETYGKLERRAEPPKRVRPTEPPQRTARTVTLRHERVQQPSVQRSYMTPSDVTAKEGVSEALDLLGYILGSGSNSRLYKSLVVEQKIATSAGAYYQSGGLDDTRIVFYGTPTPGNEPEAVIDGVKKEINKLIADGVSEEEVARAKRAMLAETFYAQDSQASLARMVGSNLTSGSSLDKIRSWPKRIAAVTPDDVVAVAKEYLKEHRSVTGYLLPPEPKPQASAAPEAAPETTMSEAEKPAASDDKTATVPNPQPREVVTPKDAPRPSIKVPAPQSRPQGKPKAKPVSVEKPEPTVSNTIKG